MTPPTDDLRAEYVDGVRRLWITASRKGETYALSLLQTTIAAEAASDEASERRGRRR
jgi:hypothetical protein